MRVSEVFEGLQGEGKYAGVPVLFIRLSGCTRACDFCDSKYHIDGEDIAVDGLVKKIKASNKKTVVWTGGEPMLQQHDIYDVIDACGGKEFHLETNGDILPEVPSKFDYLAISPKDLVTAKKVAKWVTGRTNGYDIKIVTDLEMNKELIPYATMLMPLTYTDKDDVIARDVWKYCDDNNIRYCPRLQVDLFGQERGK